MTCTDDDFWFQTHSGRVIDLKKIKPDDIIIADIAHALSNICRFGGHAKSYYSIAQHSIHVSRMTGPRSKLAALLHSASAAYFGEINRPLKQLPIFAEFVRAERDLQAFIEKKFGVSVDERDRLDIEKAEHRALSTEARDFMFQPKPGYWTQAQADPSPILAAAPHEAKKMFLNRFEELMVAAKQTSLF